MEGLLVVGCVFGLSASAPFYPERDAEWGFSDAAVIEPDLVAIAGRLVGDSKEG